MKSIAALLLIVGLACTACGGGFLVNGGGRRVQAVTVSGIGPLQTVKPLPLSYIGTGSRSLGHFAVYGNVRVRATCVGTGKIAVNVTSRHGGFGVGPVRCHGERTLALDIGSNYAARGNGGPAQITVRAPAQMTWWLDVVDRQQRF